MAKVALLVPVIDRPCTVLVFSATMYPASAALTFVRQLCDQDPRCSENAYNNNVERLVTVLMVDVRSSCLVSNRFPFVNTLSSPVSSSASVTTLSEATYAGPSPWLVAAILRRRPEQCCLGNGCQRSISQIGFTRRLSRKGMTLKCHLSGLSTVEGLRLRLLASIRTLPYLPATVIRRRIHATVEICVTQLWNCVSCVRL